MTCPKCRRGFVTHQRDRYGAWRECLNCGWAQDDGTPIDYEPRTEAVERQLSQKRLWRQRQSESAKLAWAMRRARCAGK